jgi:hypothetical protein
MPVSILTISSINPGIFISVLKVFYLKTIQDTGTVITYREYGDMTPLIPKTLALVGVASSAY